MLHTDATGALLEPPIPTPGVRSPSNPQPGGTLNLANSMMNDNNFPATGGRGPEVTDANEYLEITLDRSLKVDTRLLAR